MQYNPKNLFAHHLAREFTLDRLIKLHESISAHIISHERFMRDAFTNNLIQRFTRPQQHYFAIMQATHDVMDGCDKGMYRLKETSPKGGIYPLVDLPSFSIITRRSNTLKAFQKANYLKNQAINNASFEQITPDLFEVSQNPNITNTDRVFMILDVYIDELNHAHLNFLLPSSDLHHIHLTISYDEVLNAELSSIDNEVQVQPATATLKQTLQDLDAQVNQ